MTKNRSDLMQILLWRGMVTVLVLLVVAWFYLPSVGLEQRYLLAYVALLFVALSVIQSLFIRYPWPLSIQLFFQFLSDILLIAMLVFATGGYQSPFVLLFGLVIVAAGTQAIVLLVLSLAVFACIAYLTALYGFAWWYHIPLPAEATLQLLLQISVLMLVGGVMAVIARRHATLSDKSERAAQQHQDFQALHTRLMASMEEGVLVLDADLTIRDSNPAACAIFHISEHSGLNIRELCSIPHGVIDVLQKPKNAGSYRGEWQQDDAEYLVTVGKFPELYAGSCWWLTFVDVSELRALERKVAEQHKLAAMGRMAAMLAHELRNPMQTIAQAVELVTRVPEEKQVNIQRIVSEEISRLNRLVTDMLDYTKPLTPRAKPVEIAELLNASIEQIDPNGKLSITSVCDVGVLNIDADHMRLVLDNLLRNAVLASPLSGTVSLRVVEDSIAWQFSIIDHGDGIPKPLQAQVFEPFASHRIGGTGLGLATVWQVCQANHWQVSADSHAGTTIFCVRGEHVRWRQHG
ncbi:MAG: ATP-binding protein [Mariprofundaceae bacterium]|nr:ATP-binding protein [Mariprofundaceae bacterium]